MKYSALYPIVAGLALSGMLLPGTALAEKKTPFTCKETDTEQNFGWFPGMDGKWYVFDGSAKFKMESNDEPRVVGQGEYSMYAIMDMNTGAITLWAKFHLENANGDWDGFSTGTEDEFTATCVGSGEYAGLVSRWQWTRTTDGNGIYNWKGYIVENGPGYVPFKNSGWREENVEVISQNPPILKATSFGAGAGQGSHIGIFTDIKEVGLMGPVLDETGGIKMGGRGMGVVKAANGDLVTWVSMSAMNANGDFVFEVFFAGGTGRFEHAVGSWKGELKNTTPTRYTYTGTGTIRY